jgi:hypothetical protein
MSFESRARPAPGQGRSRDRVHSRECLHRGLWLQGANIAAGVGVAAGSSSQHAQHALWLRDADIATGLGIEVDVVGAGAARARAAVRSTRCGYERPTTRLVSGHSCTPVARSCRVVATGVQECRALKAIDVLNREHRRSSSIAAHCGGQRQQWQRPRHTARDRTGSGGRIRSARPSARRRG